MSRKWGSIYPVWTVLWQQSDPQRPSQTQHDLFHVSGVFCLLLLETPTRHHGPIRELLANNATAQCHVQLLPVHNSPRWTGLYLFIPFLQSSNERQSWWCVFIMTWLSERNLKKESLKESKRWGCIWCWTQVVSDAGISWLLWVH